MPDIYQLVQLDLRNNYLDYMFCQSFLSLIIVSCLPTYKELTIIAQTVVVTTAGLGFLSPLSKRKYEMSIKNNNK